MAERIQNNPSSQRPEDEQDLSDAEVQEAQQVEGADTDIADILNEIDGVLEKNAEEFVRSYVQKGGQ